MKYDTCNISRYVCKIWLQYPGTVRTGYTKLLVQNEMWRYNIRYLKRGDLNSDIFITDNTYLNDGRTKQCEAICDEDSNHYYSAIHVEREKSEEIMQGVPIQFD